MRITNEKPPQTYSHKEKFKSCFGLDLDVSDVDLVLC